MDTHKLSLEEVLKIECIEQAPVPKPYLDLPASQWIGDIKTINENWLVLFLVIKNLLCNFIFSIVSVNYGGEITIWYGSKKLKEKLSCKLDKQSLKCIDTFLKGRGNTINLLTYCAKTFRTTSDRWRTKPNINSPKN